MVFLRHVRGKRDAWSSEEKVQGWGRRVREGDEGEREWPNIFPPNDLKQRKKSFHKKITLYISKIQGRDYITTSFILTTSSCIQRIQGTVTHLQYSPGGRAGGKRECRRWLTCTEACGYRSYTREPGGQGHVVEVRSGYKEGQLARQHQLLQAPWDLRGGR